MVRPRFVSKGHDFGRNCSGRKLNNSLQSDRCQARLYTRIKSGWSQFKSALTINNLSIQRLGSPSTTGTFENEVWYYISTRHERRAFFAEKVTDRQVLAVVFSENDLVNDLGRYGLEDGQVVSYVDRKTPTRGKELGFLEQIFGNLGRLPAPGGQQ